MSDDDFITTKIFVEYYNKLVIEINKIIKRVEKVEKNIDILNSDIPTSLIRDSLNNKNTTPIKNNENSPDQKNKNIDIKKRKISYRMKERENSGLLKQKDEIGKINNNNTVENTTNIYKKENNVLNYKLVSEKKDSKFNENLNKSDNIENVDQAKLIDYYEFSFKNILDMQDKQMQLKKQKSSVTSRTSKNTSKKLKTYSSDIIKQKKNSNENKNQILKLNSDIIKSNDEINLLLSNIIKNFNINMKNKENKFNLIYKATKNGDKVNIFHKLCDNKKNVIVAIETKKGCRFGGFTKIGFDSEEESKKDDAAFLFSFDKMKIYKIKKGCRAIACYSQSGPCFFGSKSDTIHIENNFLENNSHTDKRSFIYEKMEEDYELNKGEADFIVKELEIFRINVD